MSNSCLKKIISCLLCVAVLSVNIPFMSYATGDGEDTFSWESLVPQTPAEGNVMVGFSGAYYVETAETILARVNEIRLEACREGVKDPYTGNALTEADYKPLQWSSDLEAIARLRAAEASIKNAHERPNGERCFSIVTTNNEQSWAENLAWNYSGIMQGIEQFYEEKADWVNNNTSAVTGHYESLISTRFNYMSIGCFRLSSGGWYAVAQEFSDEQSLSAIQDLSEGECIQNIEVPLSQVKSIAIGDAETVAVQAGATNALVLNSVVTFSDYYGDANDFNTVISSGATWTSSDTSVATVDSTGMVSALKTGTTTIQSTVGSFTDTITVNVYAEGESLITLQAPARTTYKVGEELVLAGGSITNVQTGETVNLTADMVSGFSSTTAGICTVTVSYEGYTASFDTLIVAEPASITAQYGRTLSQIALPTVENGTYTWEAPNVLLEEVGAQKFQVTFTPTDTQKFQSLTGLEAEVEVYCNLETNANIILTESALTYNGIEQQPALTVKIGETELVEGKDYTVAYINNKNVGTATVTVSGQGYYQGSKAVEFIIVQAKLTVKAKDVLVLLGEALPEFEYEVVGLAEGENLVTEPTFTCGATDSSKVGVYEIVPAGATASDNYDPNITYESGKLTISEEKVGYTVTFNMQGHGEAIEKYAGVKAGNTIERPADPVAEGYIFEGWYKEATCTNAWDFDKDIVQADIVLYAKWLVQKADSTVTIKDIKDVYYTGKACKPVVQVYDEGTLLKANKDYKITYYNNISVNQKQKTGDGTGASFDRSLPYVQIEGKGNYSETLIQINFNILPALIGKGDSSAAKGFTVKTNSQMVASAGKSLNPFVSIKGSKSMKKDVDYTVNLSTRNAYDAQGNQIGQGTALADGMIPAGYSGSFRLDIVGKGNYGGSISTEIYVADKSHLMKNASVKIGKNIKKQAYSDKEIILTPGYYDSVTGKYFAVESGKVTDREVSADDVFTVGFGKTSLIYQKDYTVSYQNNNAVGRAILTVVGKGKYAGTKAVNFQIVGEPFSAKYVQIQGLEDKTYTGSAILQNHVKLTYVSGTGAREQLEYGRHYTISYKNNIKKGTATMTFTALASSGYQGKFSKSFKILAADVQNMVQAEGMKNISVEYEKAGATPYEYIQLNQPNGRTLVYNRDYTVSYRNNKVVAKSTDSVAPTMIVKGKGNYAGTIEVPYSITQGDLGSERISMASAMVSFHSDKAADAEYKPAVTVMDGKKRLSAGKDYAVEYVNNTQEKCKLYLEKYKQGTATSADVPKAIITAVEGSCYKLTAPIELPLSIYETKLSSKNLHVVVGEATYTGRQVKPSVAVYYHENSDVVAQAKGYTDEQKLLALGMKKLEEGENYTLSYGKNVTAGKNKGSVKISGASPLYGGSVTVKFTISGKKIVW